MSLQVSFFLVTIEGHYESPLIGAWIETIGFLSFNFVSYNGEKRGDYCSCLLFVIQMVQFNKFLKFNSF